MKETKSFIETIGGGALTVLPIVGYFYGHSEGVKEGAAKAGDCFEEKYRLLKERLHQIRHDIFGEETYLIFPDGWDEEYWLNYCWSF